MNIYDDVNNLVANLKRSDVTQNFKKIRKELKETKQEIFTEIEEFQKLNLEINTEMLMEGKTSEEKENKSKQMYEKLTADEDVVKYFAAEVELNRMLEDVNTIFMNGIREIYID